MINKRILHLQGVIDASTSHQEASITEFKEINGFVDEEDTNLIEVFESINNKKVKITIEYEE